MIWWFSRFATGFGRVWLDLLICYGSRCWDFGTAIDVLEENYLPSLWHVPTLLATVHRPHRPGKTGRYSAWAKWGRISYLCRSINDTLCPNTCNAREKIQIRINQSGSKPWFSLLYTKSPQTDVDLQKNGTPFHDSINSMQHNFGASAYFEAKPLTK